MNPSSASIPSWFEKTSPPSPEEEIIADGLCPVQSTLTRRSTGEELQMRNINMRACTWAKLR